MVFSLILFLLVIVMGLCLACWLAFRVSETSVLPNSKTLQAEAARLKRYQVLCRLFDPDDQALVETNLDVLGHGAVHQLSKSRRQIMRMYLWELRSDFSRFWSLCRLLAPYSPDPQFATMLFGQLFLFHGTLVLLWARTYTGAISFESARFGALIDAVQKLRGAAQSAVEGAEQSAVEGAEQFALDTPSA